MEHLLALHSISKIGSKKLGRLLAYFGDSETAWHNAPEWGAALELSQTALAQALVEQRLLDVAAYYEEFLKSGAQVVTQADANYPALLQNIADAPYLLYYKGSLPPEGALSIAIVGSRKATAYGKEVAGFLGKELGQKDVWVVSGLARGIDSAAHQGAIEGGGKTIGVLGCGIDVVYPRENKELFAKMEQSGCIVSDYPLGAQPLPANFPIRNRIISGLADGLVVVEAAQRSGTQITVDYALEQGRDIFAVPGPIFSLLSQGTHRLIRDYGIKLVTCAADILEDYGQLSLGFGQFGNEVKTAGSSGKGGPQLTPQEKKLLDFLLTERHFNEILSEMELQTSELAPLLTLCELRGYISRLDGQYYIRKNQ